MLKVSVIVPVYNPGANIDECIASLLDQSLPRDAYEAIFVDDGSTDGTGERLEALAAEHPHVRVERIERSGWSGRPRNVGLDLARGEFVYFVDNDDWIDREALERLYDRAAADRADIVVGKVVGHGKFVPSGMFRRNLTGVSLAGGAPLLGLLSPHKLFRRAFLAEHGIRFPEGPRRLEDHVFVLRAYFRTDRVSVLGDHPCYHWVLRPGDNASIGAWDPQQYYANLREVLDVVDAHTEPGDLRDRLYRHYYRGKVLARVSGRRAPLDRPPEWRRAVIEEARRLVDERFDERLDATLPLAQRTRARLLRAGDGEGMDALAAFEAGLEARATLAVEGHALRVEAEIEGLRFRPQGKRIYWEPPAGLAGRIPEEERRSGPAVRRARVRIGVRAAGEAEQHVLESSTDWRLEGDRVLLTARAPFDPRTAAAGAPLDPGEYEVPVLLTLGGFAAAGACRPAPGLPPATFTIDENGAVSRRRVPSIGRALRRAAGRR